MDSLTRGRTLEETMYLACMKNTSTAAVYSNGLKVLCLKVLIGRMVELGMHKNNWMKKPSP